MYDVNNFSWQFRNFAKKLFDTIRQPPSWGGNITAPNKIEVIDMARDKLTIKQEKFAQGLFSGLSQREAYKQAYNCERWTDNAIDVAACKLSNSAKVMLRIKELQEKLCNRNMVTVERVLQEYAKLGFFDPRKLFNDNGSPKDITELDDDTAAALAGLDVQEVYEGTGDDRKFVGYTKKYKLVDKKGALDSMGKFLGMFTDKMEITGKDGGPIETVDLSGMDTDTLKKLAEKL
jgi:phage terminase small subunit